jgi:type VI secretion system protein ImpH
MSSQGRRENTSVIHKLTKSAYDFSFVQAVRLLERSSVKEKQTGRPSIANNPVAGITPPATESVRFKSRQSLVFPSCEIGDVARIDNKTSATEQWQVVVNLIGLTGAMGVLPFHYTELIQDRQKVKDATLEHFLNIFNHRTTSLYFQASVKYRLALQYERHKLFAKASSGHSPQTRVLLSLIGLGSEGLANRLNTRDESLLYYAGLFNQQIRTTSNLTQILRSHFRIPIEITQFVGQWQELIDDVRTRLPDIDNPSGRNAALGRSAMIGKKGWFAQGKIYIVLGTLNKQELKKFAPGTATLKALNELVRMYVGMEIDYEFKIRINKKDIPEKISLSRTDPPIIGWNSWLRSKPRSHPIPDETLDISVSASQLR